MVSLNAVFQAGPGMSPEIAAELSRRASAHDARVSLRLGDRSIRLDSLIGILAVEMPRGSRVTVVADGPEETAAAQDILNMLSGN